MSYPPVTSVASESVVPKLRKRGVVLTLQGKNKLWLAIREAESQDKLDAKYTIEELSARIPLDPGTVSKVLGANERVDRITLERFFRSFNLDLKKEDYYRPAFQEGNRVDEQSNQRATKDLMLSNQKRIDWGIDVDIDVSLFRGRTNELETLEQWIIQDRCRLVALLGMGGIGKTSLARKLVDQIQSEFEMVVWRSLKNSPPLRDVISSLIYFLSDKQETEVDLPEAIEGCIAKLLEYLKRHRCLVILDNAESVLKEREFGVYRQGYEDYGGLLMRVGEVRHQSCLILTGREKPKEMSVLEGNDFPVRLLPVGPIENRSGQEILRSRGLQSAAEQDERLIRCCGGNPLALKIIAPFIQNLFGGDVAKFLKRETLVVGDIRPLLDQQFNRLSDLEKAVMYWLAVHREPVSIEELQDDIIPNASRFGVGELNLLDTLQGLVERSLIETHAVRYTQQPVVMEYMTTQLIDQAYEEIRSGSIRVFNSCALIVAHTKDYLREIQIRLILKPIINRLLNLLGDENAVSKHLINLLALQQADPYRRKGYAGGNILNLLCHLGAELEGLDFSYLDIRQAYLQTQSLHGVSFAYCDLSKSVFAETFGSILTVAYSPDGELLGIGDAAGGIYLQSLSEQQSVWLRQGGHTNRVRSIAFSPDNKMLASGGDDGVVRLWDTRTYRPIESFKEYNTKIWAVAFSPDGQKIASGSEDRLIRIWDIAGKECLRTIQGHTGDVLAVAFSPDGEMLATSSCDTTVRLWSIDGKCLKEFNGHTRWVTSIAFSPDGKTLVSGSEDKTLKLWDVSTGRCLKTLEGHSDFVFSVAISPDGKTIASGSRDSTVRFWSATGSTTTNQRLRILSGHNSWVRSIAFSPDSKSLSSGGDDQTLRQWDVNTGHCLRTVTGFTNWVWSVAFSPDGKHLACGSEDCGVWIWNVHTKQLVKSLEGHAQRIWSVVFSPDQRTLASAGDDCTIRLWDIETEKSLTLRGHTDRIRSIAFSPHGKRLASCGDDCFIRIWDTQTGECLRNFKGHDKWIWSVAFSPDGATLVTGGDDCKIRIWNADSGRCLKTFSNGSSWVWSVAFSPDGETIVCGSSDQLIRIWDVRTEQCIKTLRGHEDRVRSVSFSTDGRTIASSSEDQTIRIWDVSTKRCVGVLEGHSGRVRSVAISPDMRTIASGGEDATIYLWDIGTNQRRDRLRPARLYEGLNIQGAKGLTPAQKAALLTLGSVEG